MATVTAFPTVEPYSPDFLDLYEWCARTGDSYSAVVERARTGTMPVPVVRSGRRFLIPRKAYNRLMGGETAAPDAA